MRGLSEIAKCCICYEDKGVDYSCECCKEGKICSECICDKRRIIEDDEEYVKCPICRTHNWKHLYYAFVYDLDAFFEKMWCIRWKPVYDICYRNNDYN